MINYKHIEKMAWQGKRADKRKGGNTTFEVKYINNTIEYIKGAHDFHATEDWIQLYNKEKETVALLITRNVISLKPIKD